MPQAPARFAAQPIRFDASRTRTTLFAALRRASREFGPTKVIVVDGDDRELPYRDIIRAAFALGPALKPGTRRGDGVGIMLPTGAGAVVAFFAVSAYGRVPAMLNFTAGARNIRAAMKAAAVTRIVTARKFVELADRKNAE